MLWSLTAWLTQESREIVFSAEAEGAAVHSKVVVYYGCDSGKCGVQLISNINHLAEALQQQRHSGVCRGGIL